MEFGGSQLLAILDGQWDVCLVELRHESAPSELVEPDAAAKLAADGNYIGVGHHRRIFYLRPRNMGLWRGSGTTERSRNSAGVFIGPPDTTLKHVAARE